MGVIFAAVATAVSLAGSFAAHAAPAAPTPGMSDVLMGLGWVHCTPGKNHHFPTWNYQRDGCRRGPRKNGPRKKTPPARS